MFGSLFGSRPKAPPPTPPPPPAAPKAPGAAPAPASLPPDWTEHTDPATGKTYYHNKVTKESTWIKPASKLAATPLPPNASGQAPSWPSPPSTFSTLSPMPAAPKAPGAAPAPASLPPNWTEHTDPATGRTYYHNKVTKESTWIKPASKLAATPLPPNASGQAPSWPSPPSTFSTLSPMPAAPKAPGAAPAPASLPPNWTEHTDPATGRTYYYNKVTEESTWIKPAPKLAAAPVAPKPPGEVPSWPSPKALGAAPAAIPDGKGTRVAMFSARFDGGEMERMLFKVCVCPGSDATCVRKFREVFDILKRYGYDVLMVEADAGDDFGVLTTRYLDRVRCEGGTMLAVCTRKYGEKTASPFSSHEELQYAKNYKLRVVPLKVEDIDRPEPPGGPGHPHDPYNDARAIIANVFYPNIVYLDCREKTEMQIAALIATQLQRHRK